MSIQSKFAFDSKLYSADQNFPAPTVRVHELLALKLLRAYSARLLQHPIDRSSPCRPPPHAPPLRDMEKQKEPDPSRQRHGPGQPPAALQGAKTQPPPQKQLRAKYQTGARNLFRLKPLKHRTRNKPKPLISTKPNRGLNSDALARFDVPPPQYCCGGRATQEQRKASERHNTKSTRQRKLKSCKDDEIIAQGKGESSSQRTG
jgi:hypothetical protein